MSRIEETHPIVEKTIHLSPEQYFSWRRAIRQASIIDQKIADIMLQCIEEADTRRMEVWDSVAVMLGFSAFEDIEAAGKTAAIDWVTRSVVLRAKPVG